MFAVRITLDVDLTHTVFFVTPQLTHQSFIVPCVACVKKTGSRTLREEHYEQAI